MATSVFAGTVKVVWPEMDPEVAKIVVEPAATALTTPFESMVATDVLDELHVTDAVRF
jgi:hypothetical protein